MTEQTEPTLPMPFLRDKIKKMKSQGKTLNEIADACNKNNWRTGHGKPFNYRSISHILKYKPKASRTSKKPRKELDACYRPLDLKSLMMTDAKETLRAIDSVMRTALQPIHKLNCIVTIVTDYKSDLGASRN